MDQRFVLLAWSKFFPSALCHLKREGQGKGLQADVLAAGRHSGSVPVTFLLPAARALFIPGSRKAGLREAGRGSSWPLWQHASPAASIAHPGSEPWP